jgi:hypothetical protein
MHSNFLDKRRRHLRLQPNQVDVVLPDHFSTSYPKFIKLLTYYYEFLSEEKSTELLSHLFATRDITETDITLLSYIEDELLLGDSYFESFATGDAQKRAAANFSNTLFRSKGTKFAIQWFFRSFFGIDAEIVETQEQIFKLNEVGSAIGAESLHFLTDDKLYQTFAYLVRSSVPISEWKDLFKLFVHPAGMYLGGELLVSDRVFAEMISTQLVGQGLPTDAFYLEILKVAASLTTTPPEFAIWAQTTALDGFAIADAKLSGDPTNSLDALIFAQIGAGVATHEQTKRWLDFVLPSLKEQEWYTTYSSLYTTEEGVVTRRKNEVYAAYVEPDSAEGEGVNFRVRLVGSNIPSRGGTYEYYIDKGETNIADFANGVPLPDSNNRQTIVMRDDSASIYLQTFADSDETETDETFHVHFFDDENREVVIQPITIQDVEASYTITPSLTTIDEGDSVQFSVAGSLVPNSGSTTLKYQVIPSSIDSADSADFVTGTFTNDFTPLLIRDDSGSFSVQTKVDGDNDTTETFLVKLYTGSNILKATSPLITINNVSPTFSVSPDPTVTVYEGDNVEIELTVDPTTVGTTVNYTIGGTDSRVITKTGSFVITAATATYVLSATETSDVFETVSGVSLSLVTSSAGFFNPELSHGGVLRMENQSATFQITPSIVGAQNGDALSFNVTGTNIEDGIRAGYYLEHVTTTDADFSTTPPDSTGPVDITFTSNSGTVPFNLENNGDSDNEDFFFVLTNTSGEEVERLGYTIIGDATYALTTPSVSQNEGGSMQSIFTTSAPDGLYYYYIAGTVNEDDFSAGWSDISSRESFIVAGNNGVINLTLDLDQKREGTESFRIYVSDTASGSVLASTGDISVNDTSLPVYTIGMGTSIPEGTTLSGYVIPDAGNNNTENIYVNFRTISSPDSADIVTPQPTAKSISTNSELFTTAIGVKDSATGGITVEMTAHIGSYTGTQVASDTIIIQDATPSYSLVTNKTSDSASEGETIQFTFDGTNVPTGSYYYNVSDIRPKTTSSIVSASSPIIYLSDVQNLVTGMEVRGIDFPSGSTITSINTGSGWVNMSSSNTESGAVASGTEVHFALPEVFDDFGSSSNKPFGEISHTTSTSSTFNVDIATDADLPSPRIENYTMNLAASYGATAVKTKAFTIGDMTVSSVPNVQRPALSSNPDDFSSIGQAPDIATSSVIFYGTGSTYVGTARALTLSYVGSTDTELLGAWVDDLGAGFDPSDFEIQATLVNLNGSNAGTPGNFGVWETLNADRTWNVTNAEPGEGNAIYCQAQISFTIREIANTSNAATFTYYLSAVTEDIN